MTELKCGVYEHWKGGRYLVLGLARDDRTDEILVIYTRLYRRDGVPMTARALSSFLDMTADDSGNQVPRFRYVDASDSMPGVF